MRDSLCSCCGIGLCFLAVLLMSAAPGSAAILNLNFGESSSGQETNNGETWNNLQGSSGTTGSLQYSDGSAATGITATQSVGAGGGNNPSDANGAGYITGLDSVTTSLLYANVGTSRTITATVSGLAVGSLWDVGLYGGLSSSAATNYTFGVNGSSQTINRVALYNTHAPLPFTGVVADSSGEIVITVGPGASGSATKAIQGASLSYVSGPSPIIGSGGEPDPSWNGSAMRLWLRADDGAETSAGVAAGNGETVEYWRDKSNNTYDATQSNSTRRPMFVASAHNGQPALQFDGTDDYMTLGDVLDQGTNSFTIFTVFSSPPKTFTLHEGLLDKRDGSDRYSVLLFRSNHTTPGVYLFYGDDATAAGAGPVGSDYSKVLDGNPHITTSVVDHGYRAYQYLDGGTPTWVDISGIGSQDNNVELRLAYSYGNGTWDGQIAEILMYRGALSDSDRQAVEQYLATKYGVPEPSTFVLALFGLIGLLGWTRKRRTA